ncbi:hypothetical protein CCGE531_25200 (plasmid) [Rhizobium sp. CCGE531]|nr:hypothetical protein CCGE531_25200 [Rhizobium sp. CCGE531]AYG75707.1 hypothetical protein CCGE532_24705 [Rhizobium sp. CCGE532]
MTKLFPWATYSYAEPISEYSGTSWRRAIPRKAILMRIVSSRSAPDWVQPGPQSICLVLSGWLQRPIEQRQ